ncbi:centrosomal protein of 152 kDa [Chiloscyllium plagiosum]|uniref:centrosomal protein of 152 kDa n=1 Tax=Chiloscyllium plagiosum TaxID=36176 RepID=UPI001CB7BA6E|nr:centrosomal protein of 152 kDa [Chiloscyllium plagiosum]
MDKDNYSNEYSVYKGQNGHFIANENISNETLELYKVKYNPYPAGHPSKMAFNPDEAKGLDNTFEQMQSKFLDSGEASTEAHQFAQLQILYNARGRQLEEMQHKQEEFAREIRYLNHQLAMTKGEKDGVVISCQELQKLLQDAKEREVQLEGQIKALESRVQDLSASEEEALKNQKIAEAAMESMQLQLSELCRSESLSRAKEQHEAVICALKQKHEESSLVMQQTLDATSIALEEQQEICKQLQKQVKQLERQQEEAKLEKAEIINELTRSLGASQQQCRDLLQTGSVQEITQLRIQVQQVQSAKNISDSMNKALQEELADLKEQITFYESAVKINVLTKDMVEELELPLSDSYMDLGIKNGKWKAPRFQSSIQQDGSAKMSKDEIIMELKSELERSLSSLRTKRHQVTQLQHESKESQKQITEIKEQLQNAEKMARSHEVRASTLEKQLEAVGSCSSTFGKALQEEVEKLRCETQALRKETEDKQQQIEKLIHSEKQFKEANQELYNEMRQMIQDFDKDKQEALDRCERIHQQHHEDSKCRLQQELQEQHELEKTQLTQFYKQQIMQVNNHLEQLNNEMSGVQECYITICKEKDSLESKLREEMSLKLITTEQEMKKAFSEEMKERLRELQVELEEKHETLMVAAKNQWMVEKETDIEQQVEKRVALAKTHWQEEQQKLKDQEMHDIETKWQLRLHDTVEAIKQKTSPKVNQICQTEEYTGTKVYTCQELESPLAGLKMTLEHQVGEALDQLEQQKNHEDNVAKLDKFDLQNALRDCERQHEEYKAAKETQLRKLESSELQLKHELECLQHKLKDFAQQNEAKYDLVSGNESLSLGYHPCNEQCREHAQKLQQECQQLKKKLEKICRQLQQTVHEHNIEVQHLKEEHERTVNILQNEKDYLIRRLKESESTGSKTNSCLQENWNSENSCKLIPAKGLEEIRHQYLRAVNKIRGDMMHYIQESKKRAAEMIRAEVLKERQQTARKMRKYYLTCLHQLLVDGGKNDGAEKRIMNAASKLAAMAKALETPLPSRKRDKVETLTAHPNMKSSRQPPVISENDEETSGSVHVQINHVGKPSSNEDQVIKFKKHTTGTVFVPQNLNSNLYGTTAENGISDEELSTNYKQINIHKIEETADILQKETTLFFETKDGHQLNDAVSKSELLRTANLAHFQNSAKYLSPVCFGKAPTLNSIDSHKDRTSLQVACDQDCVLPSKGIHNSEGYVCSKPMTTASNNVQETPERDEGDFVSSLEAIRPCQMDTFNFRQAGGKVCHQSSSTSKPLSSTNLPHKADLMTNGATQMSPSISSVTSEISSLSDGEHACFSSKTIPFMSRIDTEQIENVAESRISVINRDQLSTRTKPPKYIKCTEPEQELALNGWTAKVSELSHQKCLSRLIPNVDAIQQDSGFDSPFLNFH